MVHVFIRHKVKDYGAWRRVFDGFASKRRVVYARTAPDLSVSSSPNHKHRWLEDSLGVLRGAVPAGSDEWVGAANDIQGQGDCNRRL